VVLVDQVLVGKAVVQVQVLAHFQVSLGSSTAVGAVDQAMLVVPLVLVLAALDSKALLLLGLQGKKHGTFCKIK
jgi:hypothetical protein